MQVGGTGRRALIEDIEDIDQSDINADFDAEHALLLQDLLRYDIDA